jgi:hypothetical protein
MPINKQLAIRRLIHAAIRQFVDGDDPLAVHLLAMAAVDVMRGYAKAKGKTFRSATDYVEKGQEGKVLKELKKVYNFLKHSDTDADAILEPNDLDRTNQVVLIGACLNYIAVFDEATHHMQAYLVYCAYDAPDFLQDDAREEIMRLPDAHELVSMTPADRRGVFRNTLLMPDPVAERRAELADGEKE